MLSPRRTFTPPRVPPLVAVAVYAVQAGTVTGSVSGVSLGTLTSLTINNGADIPFLFFSTSAVSMRFIYSIGARLRAISETTVVTGVATSISLTGPAYTDDTARLFIISTPVSGFLVELVFTTMDTQPNSDFVTVYDGVSGILPSVLRVAGSPSPLPIITSTSTSMAVLFASDDSVSQGLQGFAADFSFVTRVNQTGNISCTGACYVANVRYKW
jgi:hypothetical protein